MNLSRWGFALTAALFVTASGCTCAQPGVNCSTEADCTNPSAMKCDTDRMMCVECVVDEHCADGFVCNGGLCEAGCREDDARCVQSVCKAGVGCVQCVTDAQCPAGFTCSGDVCKMGCSADHPSCPNGLQCDTTRGQCVECLSNAQCPNAPLTTCDTATGTCVQCTDSAQCGGSTPVCDPATHTCVGCVGNSDCNGGVCHMGQCVQCLSDAQCGGTTPRCNTTTNTCVPCLPGATDNCPAGQYCRADNTCEQGCRTGTDCPSGVCLPNHSCQACTADAQCAAGNICNNGTCVGACSATSPCGANQTCCNGRCQNLQTDEANCGACGVTCGANQACCASSCTATTTNVNCGACGVTCTADQFCDGSQCRAKTFPNFCANPNVVALRDAQPLDIAATNVLASTITQYCSSQTNLVFANTTDPAYVQQDAGTLLLGGGYSVVTAGGPFPNLPVKWLERTKKVTPVYFSNNTQGTEFYFKRRLAADAGVPDPIIVTRQQAACTGVDGGLSGQSNDVFVVELAIDPASGTLALITYGLCSPGNGTQAAAWFWANVMLPNRSAYPNGWYLYEWTDTNGNTAPDMMDTFTQLASGN